MPITAKDLTKSELHWLRNLNMGGGFALTLPADMADRLKELGLAEQKRGGTGLSNEGKRIIAELASVARRNRGGH